MGESSLVSDPDRGSQALKYEKGRGEDKENKAPVAVQKAAMPRREKADNVQGWKGRFVQLMKIHKPQDKWTLDVSYDLSVSSYGWYTYEQKQVFARFECSSCSKEWKSAQVLVRFHMRLETSRWGLSQGLVKMRTFRQRCHSCLKVKFEEPIFSEEAVRKLLHNLVLKILEKCYEEPQKSWQFFKHDAEEDVDGPHDRDHCEACQEGVCSARPATQPEKSLGIWGFLLVLLAVLFFLIFAPQEK
ncbi:UNVERIFIED_CONTAM: hypothetical protein K2H54_064563 [Gekko kuhli]